MKYSKEKQVQILVSLLKKHAIKKIIVSPGMKNLPFVASIQYDSFFQVYSCVDERSAAYMACGIALSSGEPVALSCTGATASRNYYSALTEAFYNNIPILAITSLSHTGEIGHLRPQMIDRSIKPKDLVKYSVEIGPVNCDKDEWDVNTKINTALLELKRGNGGPVHINLLSENYREYTEELIDTRKISRLTYEDSFPDIESDKVAIFIGNHTYFNKELTKSIEEFCEKYNGVVLADKTSNYYGKYLINPSALDKQVGERNKLFNIDLLIHIGNISGSYISFNANRVWRVNCDGEVRDTFKKLEFIFASSENYFFRKYCEKRKENIKNKSYYLEWKNATDNIDTYSIELPFSNAYIAQCIEDKLPNNSILFLGILNTLRIWNCFKIKSGVKCYSNTGGFGIDGMLSTCIGSAISDKNKINYIILGDLSFFYDMNSLGNRHLPSNIRIILINNGCGIEFKNYRHPSSEFGDDADLYMAAAGHFGNKSKELVKHYVTDLGFDYYSASSKEEFNDLKHIILNDTERNKPLLIEIFTTAEEESKALEMISNIYMNKNNKR